MDDEPVKYPEQHNNSTNMVLSRKKIAVAMSGGTDSSAAAAILVEQGLDVIGLTAHMWKDGSRCCSVEDVERARKVAWSLGMEHYVLNAEEMFNTEIVDPFINEYLNGRTPSPCVICNQKIKFGFLLTRAIQFDCAALATGHYARIEERNGQYHLLKARDQSKDQSYFLHRLSQKQLAHISFPLANMIKKEHVIPMMREKSLPNTSRSESQDLCFVPDGEYGKFVEKHAPTASKAGKIIDTTGKIIGTHNGIHNYTIGQRRGLGIASTDPLYVTDIDPVQNIITVGTREHTKKQSCALTDVNWIAGSPPSKTKDCTVRIRYRHEAAPARIEHLDNNRTLVTFQEPQFAITPGQAGVIYDGDEVLGGGWIE